MTLLFMSVLTAGALQFTFPYRTIDLTCVGEAHQIFLGWDFSRSPFLESAIVDGVEYGETARGVRETDPNVIVYASEGVFSLPVPAHDENVKRFGTIATIHGREVPVTCTVNVEWHITK